MLIDCGSDVRHALIRLNYTYHDIENVYISHLHSDHAGGLEWLGFTRKLYSQLEKSNLFIHESMINSVWENVLSGGMRSIKGVKCTLNTYFNIHPIKESFNWEEIEFKCVQTIHVFDNEKQQPCYGLFFTINNIAVFFTADSIFNPDFFYAPLKVTSSSKSKTCLG